MSDPSETPHPVARAQAEATESILEEGRGAGTCLELAGNAHAFADLMIRNALARSSPAQRPVCQRGCTACCHLHTAARPPEVLLIADHVRETFDRAEREDLLRRIDSHVAATSGMSTEDRRAVRLPCPLLVAGSCSVYEVRPLVCRGWNSLDRWRCDEDLARPEAGLTAALNTGQYLAAIQVAEGMASGLRAAGIDGRALDLVRALKIALAHDGVEEAWAAGSGLFDAAVNETVFGHGNSSRDEAQGGPPPATSRNGRAVPHGPPGDTGR